MEDDLHAFLHGWPWFHDLSAALQRLVLETARERTAIAGGIRATTRHLRRRAILTEPESARAWMTHSAAAFWHLAVVSFRLLAIEIRA